MSQRFYGGCNTCSESEISALKTWIHRTTQKYGVKIPTNVRHAHKIDSNNNKILWRDVINLEMYNNSAAFEMMEVAIHAPPGWHKVTSYLVYDVKINVTCKARWVLDGHKAPDPVESTYAGVVSREIVIIAFTYIALNDLDVFAADVRHAYL